MRRNGTEKPPSSMSGRPVFTKSTPHTIPMKPAITFVEPLGSAILRVTTAKPRTTTSTRPIPSRDRSATMLRGSVDDAPFPVSWRHVWLVLST